MIKELFVELGLEVVKDRIKNEKERNIVYNKLNTYLERQSKINYICSMKEAIDFEGLAKYIKSDLIEDVQLRFFGEKEERCAARASIIKKAALYAQSHTSLSRKRAIKITETAIDILYNFYKSKVNRDLKFIAADIEDAIIDSTTKLLDTKTEQLTNAISTSTEHTVQAFKNTYESNSLMSIDKNIQLMRDGRIDQVEENIANWFDAIGNVHELSPDYRFEIESGTHRFYSRPITQEAIKKYPPRISCTGTIQINDKYIEKFDCNTVDYANRHHFQIKLNIKTAKKFLGNVVDPVQHEADDLIGETIIIPPKPFPPAFPCSIYLNEDVMFDYVLFRTQEILDDGTIIISNHEQTSCPFRIKITVNLQTYKTTYSIRTDNPNNENLLQYIRFLKCASLGAVITIKSLSVGDELVSGKLDNLDYKNGFDSIDDELDFLEKIVTIERYYGEQIEIPEEIHQNDYNVISYLAMLIQGKECTGSWENFDITVPLTEELKSSIIEMDNKEFTISYVDNVSVAIYEKIFNLPVLRTLESVKNKNINRLKQKAKVLDIDDDIKLSYIPGDGKKGTWRDKLYIDKKAENE